MGRLTGRLVKEEAKAALQIPPRQAACLRVLSAVEYGFYRSTRRLASSSPGSFVRVPGFCADPPGWRAARSHDEHALRRQLANSTGGSQPLAAKHRERIVACGILNLPAAAYDTLMRVQTTRSETCSSWRWLRAPPRCHPSPTNHHGCIDGWRLTTPSRAGKAAAYNDRLVG